MQLKPKEEVCYDPPTKAQKINNHFNGVPNVETSRINIEQHLFRELVEYRDFSFDTKYNSHRNKYSQSQVTKDVRYSLSFNSCYF